MTGFPRIYSDRFTKEYLKFLLEQLRIENLIETADYEPYDEDIRKKNKKCININFCGLAANTLLGNNIEGAVNANEVAELRSKISKSFLKLFEKETLQKFDSLNLYLRIRFCFSYLYSDFPVCLMKAENPANWKYTGEGIKYDFHYTNPITEKDLKKSDIYTSQIGSLGKLYTIISNNPELVKRDGIKEKHMIQIRFTVIPSPICILTINNVICSEPYLYAMMPNKEKGRSLHYPVSVVSKENKLQYRSIYKHFNYLWRQDLTLFCGDGTEFTDDNFEGLQIIRRPQDIDWHDKETRIRKSQNRNLGEHFVFDEAFIRKWKKKLTRKLSLSTSKVVSEEYASNKNLFQKIKSKALAILLTILFFTIIFFVYSLFFDKRSFDDTIEWLKDHLLYSILTSIALIIVLIFEDLVQAFKHEN